MSYLRNTFRGSLALFGVALGLIGTAGVASADDAAPTPADDSAAVVASEQEASVKVSTSAQEEDAEIGDGLFIERPAPRPDPANELRSTPTPAPAPAPAPATAPAPASGGAPSPAATATAAAAPATLIPARPTEVRGVQIERGATATSSSESVALARTGVDTADLAAIAGGLLALGALLIFTARPRRISI
jgi:hypothetical protein